LHGAAALWQITKAVKYRTIQPFLQGFNHLSSDIGLSMVFERHILTGRNWYILLSVYNSASVSMSDKIGIAFALCLAGVEYPVTSIG